MKFTCYIALTVALVCTVSSLAAAVENGPERAVTAQIPLQEQPQAVPAPSPKGADVATQQPIRLGHVDIARVAAESETGKAGQAQIAELKKKLQGEIQAKRNQLEKQKTALEAKLKTFTATQREAKAKDFQKKVEEFQKFGMNAEKELLTRQEEFSDKLFKAIEQASSELSKAKNLALVVIKRELLYLGSGVDVQDVTDGVISRIDKTETKK